MNIHPSINVLATALAVALLQGVQLTYLFEEMLKKEMAKIDQPSMKT